MLQVYFPLAGEVCQKAGGPPSIPPIPVSLSVPLEQELRWTIAITDHPRDINQDFPATMFASSLVPSVLWLGVISRASLQEDMRHPSLPATSRGEQCGWPTGVFLKHHLHQACATSLDDTVGPDPPAWSPWTHRP